MIVRHDARRLAVWAWIAVALTPVGLALVVLLGFAFGEASTGTAVEIPASIVAHLLGVAAPATAVVLSLWAIWAGARSGRVAVAVSGILLAGMFIGLPIMGSSFGVGWAVALVVVLAVLAFTQWRHHHPGLPPNLRGHATGLSWGAG